MNKSRLIGALCALWLGLGTPAMAQEEFPPEETAMRVMRPQDVDRMAQPLGLSEAQRTRLRELVVNHTREMIRLKGQLDLQRFELEVLLDEPGTDAAKATTQAQAVSALRGALEMERVKLTLDVKSVLTPEQQRKLQERPGPGRPGGPGHPGRPGGPGGPGRPGGPPGLPSEPPPMTP